MKSRYSLNDFNGQVAINPRHFNHGSNLILILAATVTIFSKVSEDIFARDGRYSGDSTSQAASVSNVCLNPILDSNEDIDNAVGVGNCAGTVSQQDESGQASAPITSQTANPTIELQRATTTSQPGLAYQ